MRKLCKQLLEKSKSAFLLSLELYNKPTISYRLESFAIFYTNAWELMLKAYLIQTNVKQDVIYKKKQRGILRESISLDDCLVKVFNQGGNPIRRNIEDIAELRNQAVHLVIPEFELVYVVLFQRGILLYIEHYKNWFGKTMILGPQMISLVLDYNPESVTVASLKGKYNKEVINHFVSKQDMILKQIKELGSQYSIDINYKLALVKNPKQADVLLGTNTSSDVGMIRVEVPKDATKTHPYTTDEAVKHIKLRVPSFTNNQFYAVNAIEDITPITKPEFVYKYPFGKASPKQYSEKYLTYLINKNESDTTYFDVCYTKYRELLRKRKKSA